MKLAIKITRDAFKIRNHRSETQTELDGVNWTISDQNLFSKSPQLPPKGRNLKFSHVVSKIFSKHWYKNCIKIAKRRAEGEIIQIPKKIILD